MTSETRHRSRSLPEVSALYTVVYTDAPIAYYGPYVTDLKEESMDDVVTFNYKELIARGAVINNPCLYACRTVTSTGTGYSNVVKDNGEGWNAYGPLTQRRLNVDNAKVTALWSANVPDLILNTSVSRAKQLAISNMDTTPYAFGEDAFEIRETLKFLRNPLSSLSNLGKTFSKHKKSTLKGMRLKSIKEKAEAVASVWLQYQFAASPLVRSVQDGLEAYAYKEPTKPERLVARGFSKDADHQEVSGVSYLAGGVRHYWDLGHSKSEDVHASILYEVSNPRTDMNWRLGFRAKDLPSTLWQVVPLSFMIDRLLDVSSFIEGVINLADPNVKVLAASVREKTEYTTSKQLTNQTYSGWTSSDIQGEVFSETQFEYRRNPWIPSVSDTVPGFTPKNLVDTATKMADLTALVIARFS